MDSIHTIQTLTSDQLRAQVPAVGVPGRSLCDCLATRMSSRTVRAQLYKRWDAEQKAAKQAEARLSQCLQRLEETRLRHLALLAREQRQLQTQLQRLRDGEPRAQQGPSTHPGRQGSACSHPGPPSRHTSRHVATPAFSCVNSSQSPQSCCQLLAPEPSALYLLCFSSCFPSLHLGSFGFTFCLRLQHSHFQGLCHGRAHGAALAAWT